MKAFHILLLYSVRATSLQEERERSKTHFSPALPLDIIPFSNIGAH